MGSTKVRRLLPRWNEVDSLSHLFLIYSTRLGFDVCPRPTICKCKKVDMEFVLKLPFNMYLRTVAFINGSDYQLLSFPRLAFLN